MFSEVADQHAPAKLRNKVNGLVRTAKSKYYCDMIEEAKGDSEKVWKAVNEACNRVFSVLSLMVFSI